MKGLEEGKMRELIGSWKAPTAGVPRVLCALEKVAMRHTGERRPHPGAASEPLYGLRRDVGIRGTLRPARRSGRDNHEVQYRSVSPGPNRRGKKVKIIIECRNVRMIALSLRCVSLDRPIS